MRTLVYIHANKGSQHFSAILSEAIIVCMFNYEYKLIVIFIFRVSKKIKLDVSVELEVSYMWPSLRKGHLSLILNFFITITQLFIILATVWYLNQAGTPLLS